MFIQVRVYLLGRAFGWPGSFGFALARLGVVGFGFALGRSCAPKGRQANSAPRRISRAFRKVAWLYRFRVCSLGRERGNPVHSVSRVFTLARLGVVGFIQVCVCSLSRAYISSRLFRFGLVHNGAHSGRRVHSSLRGFTRAHAMAIWFIQIRVGLLGRAKRSSGLFRLAWPHSVASKSRRVHLDSRTLISVHSGANIGRRVHSSSRGFVPAHLEFVGFIRVRVGSLMLAEGSTASLCLACVHSGASRGRRVH